MTTNRNQAVLREPQGEYNARRYSARQTLDLWWRPQRIDQLELFGRGRDYFLALAGVSIDELERWRARGWLSFDVRELGTLTRVQTSEIVFVRDLVQSGLSDIQIGAFLSELERPFAYDPCRVAYSFHYGWVQLPPMPSDDDRDRYFEEYLDTWIASRISLREGKLLARVRKTLEDAVWRYAKRWAKSRPEEDEGDED